jgi:hypothetical protein
MTEGGKIASTLLAGIILYFVQKLLVEPLQEFRRTLGEVSFALLYYGNVLCSLPRSIESDRLNEAFDTVRKLSSRLRACSMVIPCYGLMAFLGLVPSRKNLSEASGLLIGISNSRDQVELTVVYKDMREVGRLLGIETPQ